MNSVFAYIRVSTVRQGALGSSLGEQKYAIEAYAKKHNLTIVEWFEEQETAAKQGRAAFTKMLGLLRKGKADGLIIHKIDRGARNLKDWADLGNLMDQGFAVHFAHESLDLQTRGGRLAADIQAVVAADYIRNLRDEVRKGFQGRLRQGIYPLRAPLGYLDQGKGKPKIPDPKQAPLIQMAFQLYATGLYNLHTLGEALHNAGLRNKRGNRVSINGLSTLLNNEFYIGIMHIFKTDERYQGIHQPLIKKSLFDQVQDILHGRTKNRGLKHAFRYRKTLQCTTCKYNLIGEKQKGIKYYRCHSSTCPGLSIREDSIDGMLGQHLMKLKLTAQVTQTINAEFKHLHRQRFAKLDELMRVKELELGEVESRTTRLVDAYVDRLLDMQTFSARNRKLLHDKVRISEQLEALRAQKTVDTSRSDEFVALLAAIAEKPDILNAEENLRLLKKATSNILVKGKYVEPQLKSPFAEVAKNQILFTCDPQRDTCRTEEKKVKQFIERIFQNIHDEKPQGDLPGC